MVYIRHIPSPPLNHYIYYFYYLDGLMLYPREKVFPLPSVDLKINFGGALKMYEIGHGEPFAALAESWCVGVWSVSHAVDWPPDVQLFGLCFKPDGAYPFLQIPLSELHNQIVPLDAIWGQFAAEIRERLYAAPTIQRGFSLLERVLLARLGEVPHSLDVVQYAMSEITRQRGALSMRDLSDQIGISQNHMGRLFNRILGIPPKELARFHRFEHVLRSINPTQPVDWTLIAHQSHFFDLSHLNKDFLAFTGYSPSDYLQCLRQLDADLPEQDSIPHSVPIG